MTTRPEDSFADWVAASGPRLKRMAFLLTGDLHEAEDLLQTAYAKALPRWRALSTYDAPEAWMYKVMVNQRTSWWRRSRKREWSTDQIPERAWRAGTAGEAEALVESQSLLAALRDLPERQRAAVVLRHWCDLSEAETAEVMRVSVGTVKSSTARGLAHLRTALAAAQSTSQTSTPHTDKGDPS
ncbi:MAG: SigE family RNA polymerase sigma factor [Nocardioides sp.]